MVAMAEGLSRLSAGYCSMRPLTLLGRLAGRLAGRTWPDHGWRPWAACLGAAGPWDLLHTMPTSDRLRHGALTGTGPWAA